MKKKLSWIAATCFLLFSICNMIPIDALASSDGVIEDAAAQPSNFDRLLEAPVGVKVQTGIMGLCDDNWYKFDEDDENIYLLYGGYYKTEWLYGGVTEEERRETDLTVWGDYEISASEVGNGTDIVNYLLDESKWSYLKWQFSSEYPLRTITVTGAPTKEQVERVIKEYPTVARDLLCPREYDPYEYNFARGYWLATEDDSFHVYIHNNIALGKGVESSWCRNAESIRPLVAISKRQREKTEQERLDEKLYQEQKEEDARMREAEGEANDYESGGSVIQANGHTLKFGVYSFSGADGAVESYEIREDGTCSYSSSEFNGNGTFQIEALDDDMTEWTGEMQLVVYFDGADGGGRDWLDIPEDNVLENWMGNQYAYTGD